MNDDDSRREPMPEAEGPRGLDLQEMMLVIYESRALVAAIVVLSFLVAVAYAYTVTPQYRTNALLQLEKRERGVSGIAEFNSAFAGYELPTEAEIEIIRSRSVMSPAIDALRLDIAVGKVFHPAFGEAIAAARGEAGLAPPLFGLEGWCWGGEQLTVDRLDLAPRFEGLNLELVAAAGGAYALRHPETGELLLEGKVGEVARATDGSIEMFVSELVAHPSTRFTVRKSNRIAAIGGLQANLSITERGRSTGIIELSYVGPDPAVIARILDAIANAYLRQDVERRSAEAAKTLEFLQVQMPELKAKVEAAEAALAAYRTRTGAVDLSASAQGLLEEMSKVESELSALQLQQAEMRQRFTASHPAMQAMADKIARTQASLQRFEGEMRKLPAAEQDSTRLLRDVRVTTDLYLLLLNKTQELSVAKAGTVGDVRIVDPAFVPTAHFKPLKRRIGMIGLLVGLLLGFGAAFLRRALDPAFRTPDEVERRVGISVYAAIPHSDEQWRLERVWSREGKPGAPVLAQESPRSLTMEGVRSLRTALQFATIDAPNNVIAIAGSIPGVGKSFTALNLAHSIAELGRKVLLVDCDLRRGSLHRSFGLRYEGGLSEALAGTVDVPSIIHRHSDCLHFIKCGRYPPNPAEVLTHSRFRSILEQARKDYDLVLLDAPPVLPVTDGVLVSQPAGTVFLVVREGKSSERELGDAVRRLRQNGVVVKGAIYNDLGRRGHRRYGGYGYGYSYYYSYGMEERESFARTVRRNLRDLRRLLLR